MLALVTSCVAAAQDPNSLVEYPYRLAVVTDDDFLSSQSAWCDSALTRAQATTASSRPELRTYRFQPAGVPGSLNEGRPITGPRRTLCFWLDEQGRIMNFCVGVPDAKGFQRLTEEADEFSIVVQMQSEPDSELARTFVRKTCVKRVTRHYRELVPEIGPQQTFAACAEKLSNSLAADIQERYLLEQGSDVMRWISIQQHAEARRYWCAAMLPAIVTKDFETTWQEIAQSVWGAHPWHATQQDRDWATNLKQRNATEPIALQINWDPKLLGAEQLSKSPDETVPPKEVPVKVEPCSPVQLACLIQAMGKKPISMQFKLRGNAKPVHWIVFSQPDSDPTFLMAKDDQRLLELMKPQK